MPTNIGQRSGRAAIVATTMALILCVPTTAYSDDDPLTVDRSDVTRLGYDPVANKGSLWHIGEVVGAHDSYRAGYTGKGVGVAIIDTGVVEVPGLDTGNLYHGPDLSFDSQDPELVHKDAYGHGTHLASIIAGRDQPGSPASYLDQHRFNGIAPDANLLSVKVGASDGAVDVSQVIAGIDWVVEHRDDKGMNIRVINLSYGTDSVQSTLIDPLSFAVEQAWKSGIVVVVAGGNDGSENFDLANPARNPYVLAVGANDTMGTVTPADDIVPSWGTRGTNQRHVDVVAPAVSVLGARVPNGYADERNTEARVGARFARASGTSQAAACGEWGDRSPAPGSTAPHTRPGQSPAHDDGAPCQVRVGPVPRQGPHRHPSCSAQEPHESQAAAELLRRRVRLAGSVSRLVARVRRCVRAAWGDRHLRQPMGRDSVGSDVS
jgi:subtilisin family serine protease